MFLPYCEGCRPEAWFTCYGIRIHEHSGNEPIAQTDLLPTFTCYGIRIHEHFGNEPIAQTDLLPACSCYGIRIHEHSGNEPIAQTDLLPAAARSNIQEVHCDHDDIETQCIRSESQNELRLRTSCSGLARATAIAGAHAASA
jgi:hypothetical protein